MSNGRFTLPLEKGIDAELTALMERLGADAVRNSDGTELPDLVGDLAAKVYATYFVGRGDEEWALAHPHHATRIYLMSDPRSTAEPGPLTITLTDGYLALQVQPDTDCDVARWWQVIDRTSGETLSADAWTLSGEGEEAAVTVTDAQPGHVYTVDFLARQIWDPTQMYNYITNDWHEDPSRVREHPFDVRHEETWQHVQEALDGWLADHPEVDVVRFTTFFYHFTLVNDPQQRERFVDWFGYTASVSVEAMEAFEAEYGYALQAEDFVDEGYYNSSFRVPSRAFRDWISFMHRFVTDRAGKLVKQVHAAGKEAMMFLGDNWIGTEPYGEHFGDIGLDAVVGSVGSAATCRMIADIPHVRYTEGRFLPYFFPDVFREGGDPVGEARDSWITARRSILQSPLDRIGYGGYPSLALKFPEFIDEVERIATEFREIHDRTGGATPDRAAFSVAVVNSWGRLRSWQTHMVAHAKWYRQTYSYIGVLESLAGLPVEVQFLSFDDIRDGVPEGVGVVINAGAAGTAFSGGEAWADPQVTAALRTFVARGGGLVGVGEPTALPRQGSTFQLADVFGVDQELGWGLSTNRYATEVDDHFLTQDLGKLDVGEGTADVVPLTETTQVLRMHEGQVQAAVHEFGAGRAVYLSGLPYSAENSRLLHRALHWAAGREQELAVFAPSDPRTEVSHYRDAGVSVVVNNSFDEVTTSGLFPGGGEWEITLAPGASEWLPH